MLCCYTKYTSKVGATALMFSTLLGAKDWQNEFWLKLLEVNKYAKNVIKLICINSSVIRWIKILNVFLYWFVCFLVLGGYLMHLTSMSTYQLKMKTIVTIGCKILNLGSIHIRGISFMKKIPYQGLALTTYLQVWIQRNLIIKILIAMFPILITMLYSLMVFKVQWLIDIVEFKCVSQIYLDQQV
jgi:hypothetical protein